MKMVNFPFFTRKNRPQFSKLLFAKIMRNLEGKKRKKLTSNLPRFTRGQKSEEKVTKIIVRLTRGRKKGRKKELKQTRKILKIVIFSKEKIQRISKDLTTQRADKAFIAETKSGNVCKNRITYLLDLLSKTP